MTRSVPEWIAKHHDEAIPPRVRLRTFERTKGHCAICTRRLMPGAWDCDHLTALVNGGEHRERNLVAVCTSPCHRDKTRADLAEKSTVYRKRAKHVGIKKRSGFQTNRDGKFKKRMDGTVEVRNPSRV